MLCRCYPSGFAQTICESASKSNNLHCFRSGSSTTVIQRNVDCPIITLKNNNNTIIQSLNNYILV